MAKKFFSRTVWKFFGYTGLLLAVALLFLWVRPLFDELFTLLEALWAFCLWLYHN